MSNIAAEVRALRAQISLVDSKVDKALSMLGEESKPGPAPRKSNDSTNKICPVIGSAATITSNDRNNQLYQSNSNVDWQRSFVFRWRQRFFKPSGANNENGALQVFWGGDEFTSASWLGGGVTEGIGFWIQRARESSIGCKQDQ